MLLTETPIIEYKLCDDNRIFIKREDLLPFSFGGNKVRIAWEYFNDMKVKKKSCMIGYGNVRSNLCRVLANICSSQGYECIIISQTDSDKSTQTNNGKLIKVCNACCVYCTKECVAETVEKVLHDFKDKNPYYIYGDKYGNGNKEIPVNAYVYVYEEIKKQERELDVFFDYIFLATGTGMTQSGLIEGQRLYGGHADIVGISISRKKDMVINQILQFIDAYEYSNQLNITQIPEINVSDKYIVDTYGGYNQELLNFIRHMYINYGIALDTTYTGKAFWGMMHFLKENDVKEKNVLFINTGSNPLFFDNLDIIV